MERFVSPDIPRVSSSVTLYSHVCGRIVDVSGFNSIKGDVFIVSPDSAEPVTGYSRSHSPVHNTGIDDGLSNVIAIMPSTVPLVALLQRVFGVYMQSAFRNLRGNANIC